MLRGTERLWEDGMAVYIAHAIREGTPELIAFAEEVSLEVERAGFKHLRFLGEGFSPVEIAVYDLGCVDAADTLLAILNFSSTGMGVEMMKALHTGKPVIGLVVRSLPTGNISGLALGLGSVYSNYIVREISSAREAVELLSEHSTRRLRAM